MIEPAENKPSNAGPGPRRVLEYFSGAVARQSRPPRVPEAAIALACLLLFPLVLLLAYPVAWLLPWGWDARVTVTVTDPSGGTNISLIAEGTGRGQRIVLDWVHLGVWDINLHTMGIGYNKSRWSRPLTRQWMLDWLQGEGIDPSSPLRPVPWPTR